MEKTKLPKKIKIIDITYKVVYVDKPSDVDVFGREALWGQCDYWTRTIRVLKTPDRADEDIWQTLWHEIIHALTEKLKLQLKQAGKLTHDENLVDLLATGINSIMIDNGFIRPSQ